MIVEVLQLLLLGVVVFLVISAMLAPLESLGWWAGWYGEDVLDRATWEKDLTAAPTAGTNEADHYIVYLSGIGSITGSSIPREELPFLEELQQQIPGSRVIHDVFPYSVTNVGLTGERFFSWIWKWIEAQRPINPNAIWLNLVVIRNLFQVAVSADNRYGPMYNLGVAKEIWRGLLRHGYQVASHKPVVLIGTSGGGQISVGAARYLTRILDAPILVISIGGVISADPGLLAIDHLYHLYGTKDHTHELGYKCFPGRWRWPLAANSPWFRAERQGKITMVELGPCCHTGPNSAFDQNHHMPDGQRNFDKTLSTITGILQDWYARLQKQSSGTRQQKQLTGTQPRDGQVSANA